MTIAINILFILFYSVFSVISLVATIAVLLLCFQSITFAFRLIKFKIGFKNVEFHADHSIQAFSTSPGCGVDSGIGRIKSINFNYMEVISENEVYNVY